MFCHAKSFNQPIGSWNVSKVINMSYMFPNTILFNQIQQETIKHFKLNKFYK